MEKNKSYLREISSFKNILLYALFSIIYINTSDYFLETFVSNIDLRTKLQAFNGFLLILITAIFLYFLAQKKINKNTSYYQKLIDAEQTSSEQLKKLHDEYMSLFNNSPLPKWLFDIESLQFVLVNEAACTIYGYSQEEYSTMTIRDIRPSEDIPIMEEVLSISLKNERYAYPKIVRHRKKNGDIIQVRIETSLITFRCKKVMLAYAIDITAEMATQSKLIESNAKLQLASEIANLGYWTNDLVASKIEWSDEVYKIFELNPETFELTLDNIKNCFHPEDQSNIEPNLYIAFQDFIIKESERRVISGSGKIKWVLERINLVKDDSGKPIKLNGIIIDITKKKIHEQEILDSNERFKMIARATAEAIIDWDIKNDKVVLGEGFQTIFGYDLSKYDNHLWSNNIHPEDKERVLEDLFKTVEDPTKEYFTTIFRFLKANRDSTNVQYRGIFIRDRNGKATRAIAAMIDLTDTLNRIHKIEQQNKVLKDIAWTQSHVVRAPLANLQGLISLLKDNLNSGVTDDEELIDYITDSVDKLDEIIRDIVKKTREMDEM